MKLIVKLLKWAALSLAGFIGIYLITCLVVYRIPASSKPELIEGRMLYKFIEITGTNRQIFEELVMRNRTVRLEDNSVWYVSKSDYMKLWPENPHKMNKKGYTIRTKLKAQRLLFDGYSKAKVVEYEKLNESPIIRK